MTTGSKRKAAKAGPSPRAMGFPLAPLDVLAQATESPKPRGPGRPPLGERARSAYLPIKLTRAEYAAVKAAAELAGVSLSEYARRRLLG